MKSETIQDFIIIGKVKNLWRKINYIRVDFNIFFLIHPYSFTYFLKLKMYVCMSTMKCAQ